MFTRHRVPMVYSRAEVLSDAAVHAVGLVSALIAGRCSSRSRPSGRRPDDGRGGGGLRPRLIAMSCARPSPTTWAARRKDLLRRLDQSAIYVKIAGSYSRRRADRRPCRLLPRRGLGTAVRGFADGPRPDAAEMGEHPALPRPRLGRRADRPADAGRALAGRARADFAAGSIYTAGLFFFLWERLPFHNTIWRLFVLAASFVLYAAVLLELSGRAPGA